MATITAIGPTRTRADANTWVATWTMGNADVGTAIELPEAAEKSVQTSGTFASATVILQGSNDGTNWNTLTDPQGNAISFTAAGLEAVTEHTRYVRPSSSGGAGAAVVVVVYFKGQRG
jgi:hypothetical protein